ncbi:hypothetical protein GCM10010347_46480 [Streptomyces cirratus]|uniref:Uncharacterized protein n=1 Tax=Streptomyces cirratus TaxID=68187 RepID=A0ABQ3F204_9ACTN|nr:hypothetical protein GCM10010347_46480 [Streptomyces cirratus]
MSRSVSAARPPVNPRRVAPFRAVARTSAEVLTRMFTAPAGHADPAGAAENGGRISCLCNAPATPPKPRARGGPHNRAAPGERNALPHRRSADTTHRPPAPWRAPVPPGGRLRHTRAEHRGRAFPWARHSHRSRTRTGPAEEPDCGYAKRAESRVRHPAKGAGHPAPGSGARRRARAVKRPPRHTPGVPPTTRGSGTRSPAPGLRHVAAARGEGHRTPAPGSGARRRARAVKRPPRHTPAYRPRRAAAPARQHGSSGTRQRHVAAARGSGTTSPPRGRRQPLPGFARRGGRGG